MMGENIYINVAKFEIKSCLNSRTLLAMFIVLYMLLLVAFWVGYKNYTINLNTRLSAQETIDEEWEHQTRSPHAAAHWGTYLFKPYPFISIYETGLINYTGFYYRVEAHKQNQVNAVNLEDKEAFMRMNELTVAYVFQMLMPLFIIFLASSSITREREGNTLALLIAQGIKSKQLIWGKLIGNYAIIFMLLFPIFLMMAISLFFDVNEKGQMGRLLLFFLTYMIYFFILTASVLAISSFSRSSRSSLVTCLSLWIIFMLILPKIVSSYADRKYPLPTAYEFEHNVKEGFNKGLGNDGNYVDRSNAYLKTFLEKYNVDSVSQLPENIALGLDLLNSERYNNKVYEFYSSQVEKKINDQQQVLDIAGFLNPLMAVRQISMGLAATDFYHHMDFYKKARTFRNDFNETLNKQLLEGRLSDQKAQTERQAFYQQMQKFHYAYPSIRWVLHVHLLAIISLLMCGFLFAFLLHVSNKILLKKS